MFRRLLRFILPAKWQRNLVYLRDLAARLDQIELTADRAAQGLAMLALRDDQPRNRPHLGLEAWEFRIRSQSGEDGILRHIFDVVGRTNRRFVEFGIQSGRECNAAHLVLSEGWNGLFIEGDSRLAQWACEYYDKMLGAERHRLAIAEAFVTAETINEVIAKHGISGPIDLLSIDIDGNDYWIWKAISVVSPRVVVIEYNAAFGPERSVTVPYDPAFRRSSLGNGMYYGASLRALEQVARQKGYVLAGCGSNGINAFFVQQDLASDRLPERTVAAAYRRHFGFGHLTLNEQFAMMGGLPLITV